MRTGFYRVCYIVVLCLEYDSYLRFGVSSRIEFLKFDASHIDDRDDAPRATHRERRNTRVRVCSSRVEDGTDDSVVGETIQFRFPFFHRIHSFVH